jgi:TPR repeat protein
MSFVQNYIKKFESVTQEQKVQDQNAKIQKPVIKTSNTPYEQLIIDTTSTCFNQTSPNYNNTYYLITKIKELDKYYQQKYIDWLNCYLDKYPDHVGYLLGMMYCYGLGVDIDMAKCEKYLNIACDAKNNVAIYTLGLFYVNENSMSGKTADALELFKRGNDLGCAVSYYLLKGFNEKI